MSNWLEALVWTLVSNSTPGGVPAITAGNAALYSNAGGTAAQWGTLPLVAGGTGATSAAAARTALGLGSVATESTVPIAKGGTGQTTAVAAKDALTVKGADIASAGTTDLAAATGEYVVVTGTTTITALGTAAAGVRRAVRFSGALTLTHNGTSLILPGAANITTVAGDVALFVSEGSGNWRCVAYVRAASLPAPIASPTFTGTVTLPVGLTGVLRADSGVVSVDSDVTDIVAAASDTAAGKIEIADQAELEAGTDTGKAVTPGRQHFHPGHPKFWAFVTVSGGTPTLQDNYNVTSITDTGTGRLTVTIATDFSSANWAPQVTVQRTSTSLSVANLRYCGVRSATIAAGTVEAECWDGTASTALQTDPTSWSVTGQGDQ